MSFLMIEVLAMLIVVSLLSLFVIIISEKWGLITAYELHIKGRSLFGRRIGELCVFCLGFWIATLITALLVWIYSLTSFFYIVPFCSSPLTKLMHANLRTR